MVHGACCTVYKDPAKIPFAVREIETALKLFTRAKSLAYVCCIACLHWTRTVTQFQSVLARSAAHSPLDDRSYSATLNRVCRPGVFKGGPALAIVTSLADKVQQHTSQAQK